MSSNDHQLPVSIPQMLRSQFEELISDDGEELALKLFELDTLEEPSSSKQRKKRKEIDRGRSEGDERLWNDYFAPSPVYDEDFFRRRFRMSRRLFNLILEGISEEEIYAAEYLRIPTQEEISRLLAGHLVVHGFPGMLGSLDCMHWSWKNCLTAWRGQYTRGDHGHPTIMLEAVASYDLWIWHAFFRGLGASNDINVLNQSPLFNEILEGTALECNFIVNVNVYTKEYYLADGIYPEWATLVKSFTYPPKNNLKMKLFKKRQESAGKDVERAFGVLQARWGIISGPSRGSSIPLIGDIMHACVILQNMIIKDEGRAIFNWESNKNDPEPNSYSQGAPLEFQTRLQRFHNLRNQEAHQAIRNDLVEHIWATNQ